MKRILAIDPGTTHSGYILWDGQQNKPIESGHVPNEYLVARLGFLFADHLAIEMIQMYSNSVGDDVFETCVWVGRFIQAWGREFTKVYRPQVRRHLCFSMHSGDPEVRRAIMDRFGEKGRMPKGVLKGLKTNHVFSALGVALFWLDTHADFNW